MNKSCLLLIILFLNVFISSVHAQKHTISPTDLFQQEEDRCQKNAEFVFEGRVIASRIYKYDSTKILCSNIIRITKVFRGNLQLGTVELIKNVGSYIIILDGEPIYNYTELSDTCVKIFFCEFSNLYPHDAYNTVYKINNSIIVAHCLNLEEEQPTYEIHDSKCNDGDFGLIKGFDSTFISRASLYNYLRNDYHITIPVSAEELSDTIPSQAYQSFLSWYRRDVLHIPEPSDSEKVVIEQRKYSMYRDSIDSVESYKRIIERKTFIDNHYKELNSPLYFEYYWDGSLRCYMGTVVNPRRRRQTR